MLSRDRDETEPNPKLSIHLNHLSLYCQHLKKLSPRQDKFFWLLLTSLELEEAPPRGGYSLT